MISLLRSMTFSTWAVPPLDFRHQQAKYCLSFLIVYNVHWVFSTSWFFHLTFWRLIQYLIKNLNAWPYDDGDDVYKKEMKTMMLGLFHIDESLPWSQTIQCPISYKIFFLLTYSSCLNHKKALKSDRNIHKIWKIP